MLPHPAASPEEEQQRRRQLLALLSLSARPSASLWPPPSNASGAAAAGSPPPALAPTAAGGREAGGGGPWPWPGGVSPWEVALCATGTAVACENALVLAALASVASGLRAPPVFLLIGSLALADLLAGLGLLANFAVQHLLQPPSETAALGAAGLLLTAFSASLGSLLAIALDRYLSLAQALTYQAGHARGLTAALLGLLWLLCLALGLLPLLGWNCLREPAACSVLRPVTKEQAALLAGAFLLALALLLQLYVQICRIASRHAQQIATQRQLGAPPHAASATCKGLAALALVLGTFALCWTPLAIYSLVADASYPPAYAYSLALPATCNSLINPVVYAFRNPEIQKTLWLACCGCVPSGCTRPRASSDV